MIQNSRTAVVSLPYGDCDDDDDDDEEDYAYGTWTSKESENITNS